MIVVLGGRGDYYCYSHCMLEKEDRKRYLCTDANDDAYYYYYYLYYYCDAQEELGSKNGLPLLLRFATTTSTLPTLREVLGLDIKCHDDG